MGRFLNADAYASTGPDILGNNMYAYCMNSPVKYADPTGLLPGNLFSYSIHGDYGGGTVLASRIANSPGQQILGVINGQGTLPYSDGGCGLGTYDRNGCAPIAVYNAMQLAGCPQSLQSVTDEFFWDHGMVMFGLLGIGPWSMDNYFNAHGVEYSGSSSMTTLTANIAEGSIIVYTAMLPTGWHAMTALYTNGEYWIFNQYNNVSSHRIYSSLGDTYSKGWWIYGYRIDP